MFDVVTSVAINGRISISEGLQGISGKGKFQCDNRNGCEKYIVCDDVEWFFRFDKKGNDVYMKHCLVLIEPTAENKDKKEVTKTDKKVVPVEREDERYCKVERTVRKRRKK